MQPRPEPLSHRLRSTARQAFFGRRRELDTLRTLLTEGGPVIMAVHGLPGMGKSSLLEVFADRVSAAGATPLILDCRVIEPTVRGFVAELGRMTGDSMEGGQDAVRYLSGLQRPVILMLDHYETYQLMDTWLRERFLPAAPDTLRLVTASRQPPVPRWLASPRWRGLIRDLHLDPLDRTDSLAMLTSLGVPDAEADRLVDDTHGSPLALRLAAAAPSGMRSRDAMLELADLFLADVDSRILRRAVRRTSVARRVTRSLLRSLDLDDVLYDEIRQLPFVDHRRDGLRIHDAVRDALAATLRADDPEQHARCRRQAWGQLRDEMRMAPRSDMWRYTADMLFLIENPVIREAFFATGRQSLAVEPALESDWPAIRAMVAEHDGDAALACMSLWWACRSSAFHVARDGHGQVQSFYCLAELTGLDPAIVAEDPVCAAWADHLIDDPVPDRGKVLLLRRWLDRDRGDSPSPGQAACWLDIKRTYMELRPALRRVYLAVIDLPSYADVAGTLGFEHLVDEAVGLGRHVYQSALLDFGPASVDGWLTDLVGDELGMQQVSPIDRERRALVCDGCEQALTPLEFGLAVHLEDRAGRTITRDELLEHVWGLTDGSGSSNVVDAVVKALRRKLGPRAGLVETVRGHGYRWLVR